MNPYDPNDPLGTMWHYDDPRLKNMSEEERRELARWSVLSVFGYLAALIVALAICALLGSCRTTRYVQVPVTHTDTVRMVKLQRDSIVRHDSVFVNQYVKGDTVYRQVDRWLTMYRDRTVHDTAYISRRDTVSVAYPVEKSVAKPLSRWQSFQIWVGRIVMIALAVLAVAWIVRKRNWILTRIRRLLA